MRAKSFAKDIKYHISSSKNFQFLEQEHETWVYGLQATTPGTILLMFSLKKLTLISSNNNKINELSLWNNT